MKEKILNTRKDVREYKVLNPMQEEDKMFKSFNAIKSTFSTPPIPPTRLKGP